MAYFLLRVAAPKLFVLDFEAFVLVVNHSVGQNEQEKYMCHKKIEATSGHEISKG